jgi:septal ring factor EnvC (AmiA/AmiB activator)
MSRRAAWLLGLVVALSAAVRAQDRDPSEIEAELSELRERIQLIQRDIEQRREAAQSEQAALADVERELATLARTLRETDASLEQVAADVEALQRQAESLREQIDTQRSRLADQLRAAYRLGSQSRLRTLLNAEDPNRISRQLAMHGYLGRARAELVDELTANQRQLDQVLGRTRERELELQTLSDRQRDAVAAQRDARDLRERALADLAERIRSDQARLEEQQAAAAELQALLEELSSVLADIPPESATRPFADLRGALPMPLAGRVRAAFADRRNADSAWLGWLIDADTGDEVRAVAYGRVAYADWLRGYGMMLIIDHGDGWMSLYGHNQALLADVGDWVEPGEAVALAGASGGETATGLYFQLRHQGEPVDPAPWVRR